MRLPPVEVGALLLLLVALAITASFFFDPAESSSGEPRGPSLGLPADADDADAPAAFPPAERPQLHPWSVPAPARWLITYFAEGQAEGVPAHQGSVEALDLEFANAPFGDLTDDSWWLTAQTGFELAAGAMCSSLSTMACSRSMSTTASSPPTPIRPARSASRSASPTAGASSASALPRAMAAGPSSCAGLRRSSRFRVQRGRTRRPSLNFEL